MGAEAEGGGGVLDFGGGEGVGEGEEGEEVEQEGGRECGEVHFWREAGFGWVQGMG